MTSPRARRRSTQSGVETTVWKFPCPHRRLADSSNEVTPSAGRLGRTGAMSRTLVPGHAHEAPFGCARSSLCPVIRCG